MDKAKWFIVDMSIFTVSYSNFLFPAVEEMNYSCKNLLK